MNSIYHLPALKKESIDLLNINPKGIYVDATFGGGGHSRAILEHLTTGKLFGFDQDIQTQKNIPQNPRFLWIHDNFSNIKNQLKLHRIDKVDGILADLGVSFHQFDNPERGFSFRFENSALDMRMNPKSELTAANILNEYSEEALADIFYYYGEIKTARKLAFQIIQYRKNKSIQKVKDLLNVCSYIFPEHLIKSYLPQIFQAIRIEVNQELEHLKLFLNQTLEVIKTGGRLVVLSYHSLEDRIVKNFMKSGNVEGEIQKDFFGNPLIPWKVLTKKPIVASDEEIIENPRARSAKLRAVEKI